jgi:Tfp pilus assembly protein PilN
MRLNIDFSSSRPRAPARSLCLLAGALITFGVTAWNTFTVFDQTQGVSRRLAIQSQDRVAARSVLSPAQIEAINRAIRQLNLPWDQLFTEVERRLDSRVALLALEPDANRRILRLHGEAKSAEDMLGFVKALGESTFLNDAILARHEVNEADRNRPLRFVAEARWRID